MRAECVWTPADSTGALGRTAEGWYPDPLKQMGEGTLRHWDGATWGDLWAPSWGPPPGPVIPHG